MDDFVKNNSTLDASLSVVENSTVTPEQQAQEDATLDFLLDTAPKLMQSAPLMFTYTMSPFADSPTDALGRHIYSGDIVAYPNRRGSLLEMRFGFVLSHGKDFIEVQTICAGYDKNRNWVVKPRKVKVIALERVVIVRGAESAPVNWFGVVRQQAEMNEAAIDPSFL